jgi:hypothetical protein
MLFLKQVSKNMTTPQKNTAVMFLKVFYGICLVWWVVMFVAGQQDQSSNYYFALVFGLLPLFGGAFGIVNSKKWGMLSSVFGRALFFTSAGLVTWGIGQVIFSYYNLFLNVEIPYPSVADAVFILSWPLWAIGIANLWKASGVKYGLRTRTGKIILWIIPTLLAFLSYYLLVIVARGGSLDFSGNDGLKVFFDLAYPIGTLVILTMTTLVYGLSQNHLGGMFRRPVYLLLFGFVLNYIADFAFSYTTTLGTFYSANWVDLLFVTTMFILSLAVARMQPPVLDGNSVDNHN